jgi:catechol 2,3-dioxygenase
LFHVEGFADHLVSESVYLKSPDGIGFEVYADRPTGEWIREEALVAMGTLPLDLNGLMRDAAPPPLSPDAEIGHIHMRAHVGLDAAVAFYRKLGMAVTWRMPDAVFMAWGGYHHHVAFNRWPQPRQRGALAAAYTPAASRPARDPLGVGLLPAGEKLPG